MVPAAGSAEQTVQVWIVEGHPWVDSHLDKHLIEPGVNNFITRIYERFFG